MKMSQNLFIILIFALFFHYCSSSIPEMHYYLIDYPIVSRNDKDEPVHDVVIGVEKLKAAPWYKEDRLVYRDSPYEGKYYHYHRWITSPEEMITEKAIEQLNASNLFHGVVPFPKFSQVDYVLQGTIKALEEWDEGDQWYARVQLVFELVHRESNQLIWQKIIERKNLVPRKTPAEVVKGINISIQQTIEEVRRELNELFSEK